jgi:hypothetical protein|tara:strand:- start:1071 stop:1247 length:177 start_codon:yes stop_codon:yes gene_type:complete
LTDFLVATMVAGVIMAGATTLSLVEVAVVEWAAAVLPAPTVERSIAQGRSSASNVALR